MSESLTAADAVRRQQETQRQLVKDYKATFTSEKGRRVLAHMKRTVGFDECEANSETLTDNQIARRVCMKRLIFDIEKMLRTQLRNDAKPKRALSATHHEQPKSE